MPVGSRTSRPRSRHQLLPRHRRSNHDPLTPVASRMNDGISGNGGGSGLLSPIFIFFLVVVLQTLDGLLELVKRVSEPSTFAQSAKLRRMAAAKEKELLRSIYTVLLYATLVLRFWGVPVAAVPHHLLQPFGKIFIVH
ncbi:hypothetical protein BHM03_00044584 [Ensete ventricosum]|nr:hypothetical protein BHM03_00044584 [Ensete ventricosum]